MGVLAPLPLCDAELRWLTREVLAEIPERLIIYHAGTGRTTFLAMLKLTSIFIGAFFTFVVVPGYVKSDKPWPETAGGALS